MLLLDIFLLGVAGLLLFLVLLFTLQVAISLVGTRSERVFAQQELLGFAVIVPAHNEEPVIGRTLETLLPQLRSADQLIVVADNCSDATADVARQCGATVVERSSDTHLGKGFALEFGVSHLRHINNESKFVVFVDADCDVKPGSLESLVHQCAASGRPMQALYLMRTGENPTIKQKIAEFAWRIKNHARPLGMYNLGLTCQLMGTGMAFPRNLIETSQLGTSQIVEDMKLGIDLAKRGHAPMFCPGALVESQFPSADQAIGSQRTRWEHGHLAMIFSEAGSMLVSAIRRRDILLFSMTLDLMIPPIAFLVTLLIAVTGICAFSALVFELGEKALAVSVSALAVLFCAVPLAWWRYGRDVVSPGDLLWIPVYVLAKIPMYLRYWIKRQTEWIRTNRD